MKILTEVRKSWAFLTLLVYGQLHEAAWRRGRKLGAISDGYFGGMENQSELELDFRECGSSAEIHASQSWNGVTIQYSRLKLPLEYEFRWQGDRHYVAYHDLMLVDGEMEVSGERPIASRDLRDTMTYVPEGRAITGWAKPADRLNAFTVVSFDPRAMQEELQAEFKCVEPRPKIYFKDATLGTTMQKIANVIADAKRPASKIYAETLALTAALEMSSISSEDALPSGMVGRGGLSRTQRDLACAYIEENLGRDIGLEELANICSLTRFHFSRAFKVTFGEPPYQYVIRRRLERAQCLLKTSGATVSDVAVMCGFNGLSQFGRSFAKAMGMSPLQFRRNAR